ncbi:MAG: hypothetical protein LAO19_09285 [Acidobacteriia bacterium]|nr:hypothetical protein [Terriglobia bacterium]
MAIELFLLLNAMGVVFLIYVLANFWKEGSRTKSDTRPDEFDFMQEERPAVLVVTHLIAHGTNGSGSVIPLQLRGEVRAGEQDRRDRSTAIYEMQARRVSVK